MPENNATSDNAKDIAGHLAAIVTGLDAANAKIDRMEQKMAALENSVDQTRIRTATMLYAFIMSRVSPKVLEQLIPRLDESCFSEAHSSMSGCGLPKPAKWLRESVGRALMNTAFFMTSLPFSKGRKIFRLALERTTYEDRGHVFTQYFRHLANAGLYDWQQFLPECEYYAHNAGRWIPGQEYSWGICIAAHGENGDMEKAAELSRRFCRAYDPDKLLLIPEAAYYAVKTGIDSERLKLGAWVYEEVRRSRGENLLAGMLAGKTIAIVGGGPQEVGKRRGHEIDGHDLVLRVNHHPNPELHDDYGDKTDIFCTGAGPGYSVPYTGRERAALFCTRHTPFTSLITYFDAFSDMRKNGVRIINPAQEEWRGVIDPERYSAYTAGYLFLSLVKKLRPDLTTDSIYGFSHPEGFQSGYNYYDLPTEFSLNYPPSWYHNMERELADFNALFKN